MSSFDIFTKYTPIILADSIGEWVVDKENDGTPEHPILMPFVGYSEMVSNFIDDVTLVQDIQYITIGDTEKNFYSFASKYCSHHNPLDYLIYDSYVDEVLQYFRNRDNFSDFQDGDLKDYLKLKGLLIDFRAFYGLDNYATI